MAKRTWKRRLILLGLWSGMGAALVLLTLHAAQAWTPSRQEYPLQGLSVSAESGPVGWNMVKARDADFAYIRASSGADRRDRAFETNLAGARAAGLRYGPEHVFSLCSSASAQATLFISTVPRDAAMLPPAVRLAFTPDCAARPGKAAVQSELGTFLNLIEAHMGKPSLIRVSRDFEEIYGISQGINRTLWLEGSFFTPDYAARPWVMWTSSHIHRIEGVGELVEWNVVHP